MLLRAAAAEAAEEDVLPEEGEATGPRRHFGARPDLSFRRTRHLVETGGKILSVLDMIFYIIIA